MIKPYKGILPRLGRDVYLADNVVVAGDVEIGDESSLWFGCVVRGDVNDIRIGARTNIQDGSVVHVSSTLQGTYIGNDVTVGHMALLHACTVGDGAFIGMKACVMDGARVEAGAMVGAGALVTPGTVVPGGQLWLGAPARFVRVLNDAERDMIVRSAARYVDVAKEYLRQPAFGS